MARPVTQCMSAATLAVCMAGGDTPATSERTSTAAAPSSSSVRDAAPDHRAAIDLAQEVIALAVDGRPGSVKALRFADRVALGLGRHLVAHRKGSTLTEPSSWLLETNFFRSYIGPFSALRVIRNHVDDAAVGKADFEPFEVTVGQRTRCATPDHGVPHGFEAHRQISIQPAEKTLDTCLLWFSVDLFLDADDRVAAATLDLWEP